MLTSMAGAMTFAAGGAMAQEAFVYKTYPLPGTPKPDNVDNSRRIVPAPEKDYWPFSGVSGAGQPVTVETQRGGWFSNISDVRYKGPVPRSYPTSDWDQKDAGDAVISGLLPPIWPIWDVHIRDTIVCVGGDGYYYMSGTTGDNCWAFNDGIELWRSKDLAHWDYFGLVWSIERDGKWEKNWSMRAGVPFRAIWAPELHYIGGTYYLCHCISGQGMAVLRSTSGRAEGPYVHVLSDEPIKGGIDPTLFADDDGRIYLSYGSGEKIREIRADFSGFVGDWQPVIYDFSQDPKADPAEVTPKRLGFEGVTIFKAGGKYYLGVCEFHHERYSFMFASSEKLLGPYTGRHEGPAGAGGGNLFHDRDGRWWQTFFGNDTQMPFREKPALVAITRDPQGHIRPLPEQPFKPLI
ncbi:MAG: family 43 glycosylhydrolase [Asticcacaulis sp.]